VESYAIEMGREQFVGPNGRPAEFDKEVLRHRDMITRYATTLSLQKSDVEDLTAETIAIALTRWKQFRYNSNLATWLYCIARNLFLDRKKSHYSKRTALFSELIEWPDVPAPETTPKLLSEEVISAIRKLPEPCRIAVILHDLSDMSYSEIAALLGIPNGTVRMRVCRGHRILRSTLR
jgi:RNA polymerase sigma-70 factor (ECF subfamily)